MRHDLDRDEGVARAARTRLALARQPHLRAVLDARGQFQVDRLAVAQRDPLRGERGGVDEGDAQAIGDVGALRARLLATTEAAGKPAAAGLTPAEQPFEDVGHVRAFAAEVELLPLEAPTHATRSAGARTAAAEAERRGGIAVAVDLAAVEARALVLVGQQVVGARHLAEPLGRLRIVLVAVRVQLLGELAISFLDVGLGRAPRDAQGLVRIGH